MSYSYFVNSLLSLVSSTSFTFFPLTISLSLSLFLIYIFVFLARRHNTSQTLVGSVGMASLSYHACTIHSYIWFVGFQFLCDSIPYNMDYWLGDYNIPHSSRGGCHWWVCMGWRESVSFLESSHRTGPLLYTWNGKEGDQVTPAVLVRHVPCNIEKNLYCINIKILLQ